MTGHDEDIVGIGARDRRENTTMAIPQTTPRVTVLAGTERFDVVGRAAVLIGLIARYAAKVNDLVIGRLVFHLAHDQVLTEVQESLPSASLDGGPQPPRSR